MKTATYSIPNWAKVAIGVVAIAVGVIATAATGGAAAPVLVHHLKLQQPAPRLEQ